MMWYALERPSETDEPGGEEGGVAGWARFGGDVRLGCIFVVEEGEWEDEVVVRLMGGEVGLRMVVWF